VRGVSVLLLAKKVPWVAVWRGGGCCEADMVVTEKELRW